MSGRARLVVTLVVLFAGAGLALAAPAGAAPDSGDEYSSATSGEWSVEQSADSHHASLLDGISSERTGTADDVSAVEEPVVRPQLDPEAA